MNLDYFTMSGLIFSLLIVVVLLVLILIDEGPVPVRIPVRKRRKD